MLYLLKLSICLSVIWAVLLLAFRDKIVSPIRQTSPAPMIRLTGGENKMIALPAPFTHFSSQKPASLRDTLPKKTDTAKPLYVVDGVPMPDNWPLNSMNPKDIKEIEIHTGGQALRFFGPRAVNGVVVITSKKSNPPGPSTGGD